MEAPVSAYEEFLSVLENSGQPIESRMSEHFDSAQDLDIEVSIFDRQGELYPSFPKEYSRFDHINPFARDIRRFLLRIEGQASVPTADSVQEKFDVPDDWYSICLAQELKAVLDEITVAANLAFPGRMMVGQVPILANGDIVSLEKGRGNQLWDAVEYKEETGWPDIRDLPLEEVWSWILEYEYFRGPWEGKAARAFSAFTHLTWKRPVQLVVELFWAMVGIEALFNDGVAGVSRQIRKKSHILLGKREEFKKDLNKMYNFRLRFVHGDLNFPPSLDAIHHESDMEFTDDMWRPRQIAIAVLVGALQRLVREGRHEVEFEYKLVNP